MPQRMPGGFPDHPLPPVQNKKLDDVKETEMHFYLRRQELAESSRKSGGA